MSENFSIKMAPGNGRGCAGNAGGRYGGGVGGGDGQGQGYGGGFGLGGFGRRSGPGIHWDHGRLCGAGRAKGTTGSEVANSAPAEINAL